MLKRQVVGMDWRNNSPFRGVSPQYPHNDRSRVIIPFILPSNQLFEVTVQASLCLVSTECLNPAARDPLCGFNRTCNDGSVDGGVIVKPVAYNISGGHTIRSSVSGLVL